MRAVPLGIDAFLVCFISTLLRLSDNPPHTLSNTLHLHHTALHTERYSPQASVVMNRSVPESTPVRTSSDVMGAVVGEVESALRALERERNTESVSYSRRRYCFVLYCTVLYCTALY
jgi:hypothetical protein